MRGILFEKSPWHNATPVDTPPQRCWARVHNPLSVKYFHGLSAGNTHECSLKLSIGIVRFIRYTLKHPEAVKGVGRRASIVTIKPSDKRHTEKNLELARKLKKERRVVYIAALENGRW